jgi:hypothetical protein
MTSPIGFNQTDLIVTISKSSYKVVCKIFHLPASKMRLILPYVSGSLQPAGLQQASKFTWERTTDLTLNVYREVIGS